MTAGELTAAHLGRFIEVRGRMGPIECVIHDADGTHLLTEYAGWISDLPHDEPVTLLDLDAAGMTLTRVEQPSLLEVAA